MQIDLNWKKDKFKYKKLEEINKIMDSVISDLKEAEKWLDNFFDEEELLLTQIELDELDLLDDDENEKDEDI